MDQLCALPRTWKQDFYEDITLHYDDLELLLPGQWLNDSIISYYFAYLCHDKFQGHPDILFMPTSIAFLLSMVDDPRKLISQFTPLNLPKRKLILCAVNNNRDTEQTGGSHWALVAYFQECNTWRYYDSLGSCIRSSAEQLCRKISLLLAPPKPPAFETMEAPRQQNDSDCGVHVLATASWVAESFRQKDAGFLLTDAVNGDAVTKLRRTVLAMILAAAQQNAV